LSPNQTYPNPKMTTSSTVALKTADRNRARLRRYYDKLVFWLYDRENAARAKYFAEKLKATITESRPRHDAIFVEDCRSLIAEANGDLKAAIRHRENAVALIRKLHAMSAGKLGEDYVLSQYGHADLRDEMGLLAGLYLEAGRVKEAVAVMREAKDYCRKHNLEFEDDDLLSETRARNS
jgi:hypothetical protein